jgi:flagella basal body P-ring formation protein FlgA
MIKLTAAFTLLALAVPAGAQAAEVWPVPASVLKRAVTVTDDVVRVGDLIEHAGTIADIAIFRAPDLGETGTVPASRIAEAVRTHGLYGLDIAGIPDVFVSRSSRAISGKDVEARIAAWLAGRPEAADARNITISFDRDVRTIHVEPTVTADLQINRMTFDPRTRRFDVQLDLPGSAVARRMQLRFTGTAVEMVDVAMVTRPIERGDVLKTSDVIIERRPKTEANGEAIGSMDRAVGFATRRPLRPGQALRAADLMKPELVGRNETVTIVYEMPGILLSMRGKALDAGTEGDVVNVTNIQSKRTIQGTVSGPGRVTVTGLTPRLAANEVPSKVAEAAGAARRRAE